MEISCFTPMAFVLRVRCSMFSKIALRQQQRNDGGGGGGNRE